MRVPVRSGMVNCYGHYRICGISRATGGWLSRWPKVVNATEVAVRVTPLRWPRGWRPVDIGSSAQTLVLQSLARCDAADYIGESPEGQPMPKGARCLDDWTQVLSVCTRLLHDHADRELQIAAARAVAAILNYHYHPDLGGVLFAVRGDFFHFEEYWGTCVYSEAALAALTAMLDEAGRRGETHLRALAGRLPAPTRRGCLESGYGRHPPRVQYGRLE